jgi:hypothetical protein
MTRVTGLPAALRAHSQGLYCLEAAVELLIGHATWLHRDDFLHHFVQAIPGPADRTPMAVVGWAESITGLARGQLPCSGSEARMLRIAASLAEGIPVDLRDALTELDSRNTELVCHAVTRATGHK